MRRIALLALALAAAMPAGACDCRWVAPPGTPRLSNGDPVLSKGELGGKDRFVFLADAVEVKQIDFVETGMSPTIGSETTFRVVRSWTKGVGREMKVRSGFTGGGCGFIFEAGKRYIIFATRNDRGMLVTSICTRTALASAVPDLLESIERLGGRGRAFD